MPQYIVHHGSIVVDKQHIRSVVNAKGVFEPGFVELAEDEAKRVEPLLGKPGASIQLKSEWEADLAADKAGKKARDEALAAASKAEAEARAAVKKGGAK